MSKPENAAAMLATSQAVPPPFRSPTLAERRDTALNALRIAPGAYKTLERVEYADNNELRARSTEGTILEPVAKVFGLEPTYGAVMDILDLTVDHLHDAFCNCLFSETMTGKQAAWTLSHALQGRALGH